MLTTGTPRYAHSRIPTLEFPTRHLLPSTTRRKSVGDMFLKNRMLSGFSVSRKDRMALDVPSEPASTFGQNQSVGSPRVRTACSVSVACWRDAEYSVVTGC